MPKDRGRPRIENDDRGILHIRIDKDLHTDVLVEAAKRRMKINQYVPYIIRKGMESDRTVSKAS